MPTGALSAAQTRVVSDIITLIIPGYPEMEAAAQVQAHGDVTAFVGSQIAGMPSFLRFPYKLALTAFAALPLLRYGRTFTGLDAEVRAHYLALWSDAPIGVMRNFVKLIRSCAVLAYFDHPLVMRHLEAAHHTAHTASPGAVPAVAAL